MYLAPLHLLFSLVCLFVYLAPIHLLFSLVCLSVCPDVSFLLNPLYRLLLPCSRNGRFEEKRLDEEIEETIDDDIFNDCALTWFPGRGEEEEEEFWTKPDGPDIG